jgi:hypothetical protein
MFVMITLVSVMQEWIDQGFELSCSAFKVQGFNHWAVLPLDY